MPKKKLSPPVWDEKNQRWVKTAYCNNLKKNFYSKKKGVTTAEREITAAISAWKEKMEGLSCTGNLSPLSRVKEVYPVYFEDLKARTSRGNFEPAEGRFRRNILPVIGDCQIIDLDIAAMQRVINHAYTQRHLAQKTLKNIQSDLSSFLKFCRKCRITQLRLEDIDIPKSAKRPQKEILQPDDLQKLFAIDTTVRYNKRVLEPYVYGWRLQVICALRPGEVGGLEKTDRFGNIIRLRRSINVYKDETQGKNENSVRAVPMPPLACACWDALCALSDGDSLFPGFDENRYRKHFVSFCKCNDIQYVSPYELRHTGFSALQSLPEGLVKSLGGHSKNMDTFGIYGHKMQGDTSLTAQMIQDRFDDLLSNSKNHHQTTFNPQKQQKEDLNKSHD